MRKLTFFACAAALLTSTVVFTGCKNDQKNLPENKPSTQADIAVAMPEKAAGGIRHMPGTTVQAANDGTDFQGIKNVTLIPFIKADSVEGADSRLGENLVLGDINASGDLGAASNAKLFVNKQVPLATSRFLAYGESKASGTNFSVGKLIPTIGENTPNQFTFVLDPIVPVATTVTDNSAYKNLLKYLNAIAQAKDSVNGKEWRNYQASDNAGYTEMFDTLNNLTNLTSFGVQRMVNDLYKSLKINTDSMAKAIKDSLKLAAYVDVDANDSIILKSALQGFPRSLNLPEGSVAIAWNTTNKVFETSATKNFQASPEGQLNVAEVTTYTYPASLWYRANTPIMVSDTSVAARYNATNTWTNILSYYRMGSVTSKTRSVALTTPLNYAVARLDVRLKASATTLKDNATPEAAINNANGGYELKGVLVGGQKNVGYDFRQASYQGGVTTSYIIYDTVMNATIKAGADFGSKNYTLVLETPANEDEYIAIELINNSGSDFYGADGLVPAGGRFYMVAKLTASQATETGKQVFKQDYITTASLTITSLKKAYNTIPDLRAAQLEIGLSVDLTWQTGHDFEIDL